ncbi:Fur family transcriptional regulator [Allonocardiopsis opalescens]|uniref:Fur family zinc uptake regulator n=1 Tax=Allonocardiopsis opalescens TaxID=1144618 RepID=A0A2T0Q9L4_9ACTN|nr:transcriptional repressor [Allonocardiopsis opalescens]PRY00502.1 Fur family zinc uptake regulator [Allonocardiopsis opalescens]
MSDRTAQVRAALSDCDEFRSAQEVYARLRESGKRVGLATVYRSLQALTVAGEVDTVRNARGEAVYRACRSDEHHHHLVCRDCGTAIEAANPALERWADEVAAAHGFVDVEHTVEVFGTCPACAAAKAAAQADAAAAERRG